MNVLYINHYAGSKHHGMEFRPYYLASEWKRRGHSVLIVAGDYSHLRRKNPRVSKDLQFEIVDGINYCWIRTGSYEGNGIKRALSMFKFVFKLFKYAKELVSYFQPDVIISSSTYPLDSYPARRMAKLSDAKYIHEIHDMWPATLIEIGGMSKFHPFVLLMGRAERYFCKHADYIVSLLPNVSAYLVQKGAVEEHILHIPNGVFLADWDKPEAIPEEHRTVLSDLKARGKFIVGYFGGHALSNALDQVIDVAKSCRIKDIEFVLVGDGVEKMRLMRRVTSERIENVKFLDAISKQAIPSLLPLFDLVLITGYNSPLYRFGGSLNKWFDAMLAARPILMTMNIAKNPIEDVNCGIVIKESDPQIIMNRICDSLEKFYLMSESERLAMGLRGKELALKNYNYEKIAKQFESIF